ncbi:MAG: type 4a pilus biogenesis protein PilO, partial [Gaiella sp.]
MSRLKQDPKLALLAGAGALVLLLAAAWFLLVAPKRTEAVTLEQDVAAKQVELATKQAALAAPSAAVKVRASDLYRLTKALPDTSDMPAILLDVNRMAAKNKLAFSSVTPGPGVLGTGSVSLPIVVTVQGRFTSVSRFLRDVRTLVRVREGGLLDARGRTYSVSQVELGASEEAAFPVVKATV